MSLLLRYTTALILCASLSACTQETEDIDSDVRFAINTAQGSGGIAFYQLPQSTSLAAIPQDPNNPLTTSKIRLGQQLFHESSFATIGPLPKLKKSYTCASCHHADGGFQANMIQGIGEGGIGYGIAGEGRVADRSVAEHHIDVQPLRTPSILNSAYQTNLLWNGQFGATGVNQDTEYLWPDNTPIATNRLGYEGVETQAIAGLSVHRHHYDTEAIITNGYQDLFDSAFGQVPEDQRYNNIQAGLAIAAFERTVLAYEAPFQRWLRGDESAMTIDQKKGALLFFGKGQCTNCHNGPGLANMEFHAIGLNDFNPREVLNFEADDPSKLGRASFTKDPNDSYKFKVPQLYNLKNSPFYGHGASFRSIRDMIAYKNLAEPQNPKVPISQLSPYFEPLSLSEEEIDQLTIFVEQALYDPDLSRYTPSSVVSGNCIPNNDWSSKQDLDCQ